jgi:hypothetical protein
MFNPLRNLLPGSTNTIELRGLRYADGDREPVTGATVQLSVYDTRDRLVPGESWPITMSQSGTTIESDGEEVPVYRGQISHLAAFHRGTRYRVEVKAISGGGARRVWSALFTAEHSDQ